MTDIVAFQKDLKNGMELEEALNKHNVSLSDAFDYALQKHFNENKKKQKKRAYNRAGKYIYKHNQVYYIRRQFNYKNMLFGSYESIEDAKKIMCYLEKYGWEQKRVDEYCKMAGVNRHKSKYQTVVYS